MPTPELPKEAIYTGNSMRGMFVPGEKLRLVPVPFKTLRPGDVVAVFDRSPHYVHRIIESNAEYAVTMGDNNDRPDVRKLTPDGHFLLVSEAVSADGSVRCVARGEDGMKQFRRRQRKRMFFRMAGWPVRILKPLKFLRIPARRETKFRDGTTQWSFCGIPVAARSPNGRTMYQHGWKRLFFRIPTVSGGAETTAEAGETDSGGPQG